MYFETHAHYNNKRFNEDRDELLATMHALGIDYCVTVGYDIRSSKVSIDLANKYDYIYATVGVHPHDVEQLTDNDIETLRQLAKEKKVVAIGEIGFDYYYEHSSKENQHRFFLAQLNLAKELDMPVVIHSRDASGDMLDMLKSVNLPTRNGKGAGVMHCFSESLDMAKKYVNMGYFLGISGVVTYNNAKKLVEVVENIPLESLFIETDCPYLAPVPNRGKRNDSLNLKYVVDVIAKIKGISHEEVAKITKNNAERFFF